MKKTFVLFALGSASMLSANQYNAEAWMSGNDVAYYQSQPYYANYQSYYQGSPGRSDYPTHTTYPRDMQAYPMASGQQFYQQEAQPYTDTQHYQNPNQSNVTPSTQNWGQPSAQGHMTYPRDMQAYPMASGQQFYQNQPQPYYQGTQYYQDPNKPAMQPSNPRMNQPSNPGAMRPNNQGANQPAGQGWSQQKNQQYYSTADQDSKTSIEYISDNDIAKDIREALSSSILSSGYPYVTYQVYNGNVALSGTVEKAEDKAKVEDKVNNIDGVKQINNQIKIEDKNTSKKDAAKNTQDYAATDADKDLNAQIRNRLNSGWFSKGYELIILKTSNGVVTITGFVDNVDDLKKISDEAKKVSGVRSVYNQASVKK